MKLDLRGLTDVNLTFWDVKRNGIEIARRIRRIQPGNSRKLIFHLEYDELRIDFDAIACFEYKKTFNDLLEKLKQVAQKDGVEILTGD